MSRPAALALLALTLIGCGRVVDTVRGVAAPAATNTAAPAAADYTCPMHPSVHQPTPGSCPICGMNLVLSTSTGDGSVVISPEGRTLGGIATTKAELHPLHSTLRVTGTVTWDQAGLTDVTTQVMGYIRDARVADVGGRVLRGQPLLTLYSPDLLVAQEELLAAANSAGDPTAADRTRAARRRLALWGVPETSIQAILASGKSSEALPILAPVDGWVVEEDVVEGAAVMPGQRLYRIGNLRRVWVEAQVPEADLAAVSVGMPAHLTIPQSSTTREGKVAAILPGLDAASRTATVRVTVDNTDGAYTPEGWVSVAFDADAGSRLAVPESAVVWTGPRRVVFVEAEPGRFAPREVEIGQSGDGWVEVRSGLMAGESVVTAGTFAVGSETRIRGGGAGW